MLPTVIWLTAKSAACCSAFITPASDLGYIVALPPPRIICHGCEIVHWDPLNVKRSIFKNILVWAMCNCMVSMTTNREFENVGLPTKLLISQPLLILDYLTLN